MNLPTPGPSGSAGPVALVGSGEYTDAMLEVDRMLLEGRPPRFVQIPAAAAPEGQASLDHWIGLGRRHAEKLEVEAVPVVIRDRDDANDPRLAALLEGAGLIYFSGGNPVYLANTLRDTAIWAAIVKHWQEGVAVAGCSAGAMAFGGWVPDVRRPAGRGVAGLGLVPQFRVLPHFDRYFARIPAILLNRLTRPMEGITTIGIDEDTALVGGPEKFSVHGSGGVWLLEGGRRVRYDG